MVAMYREPRPIERLEPVEPPLPLLLYGRPSKLRLAIARTGYHAYQVAAAIGISPMTLSRYTNRRRPISPHHIGPICTVLGVTPEEILEDPLPPDWRPGDPY